MGNAPHPTILPWPPSVHHLTPGGPSCSLSLARSQPSGQPLGITGTCCLLSGHGGSEVGSRAEPPAHQSQDSFGPVPPGQNWHQLFSSHHPPAQSSTPQLFTQSLVTSQGSGYVNPYQNPQSSLLGDISHHPLHLQPLLNMAARAIF